MKSHSNNRIGCREEHDNAIGSDDIAQQITDVVTPQKNMSSYNGEETGV